MQIQYDYQDGDGRTVHSVVRSGDKDFFRVRISEGRKINNWDGIQVVPFNLPEIQEKKVIILVEG